MKVVTIYYLNELELPEQDLRSIKENTKADLVIAFIADNQLQGIQYPYLTVDYYDS